MKGHKEQLPFKICLVCQRPFSWRKKWKRDWESVKYCSKACGKSRNRVKNTAVDEPNQT